MSSFAIFVVVLLIGIFLVFSPEAKGSLGLIAGFSAVALGVYWIFYAVTKDQ